MSSVSSELVFEVSDFVAVFNQTAEYAYPSVAIVGELCNFRVSKNRWVYFDIKDEHASVRCFGTVYQLNGPLEDGMQIQITGAPRLHPNFGFSVNLTQAIQPVGKGALKRAFDLLLAKLTTEGLFDEARKRPLPFPPTRVGLVTSAESAAYHDFVKILNERWGGVEVFLYDVQVQGEAAIDQICRALNYFSAAQPVVDVVVVTRGGGSADDLAVFNTEPVTRAVAVSRVPTLVAIGHEVDISLAELAADRRASTPSNAAQLLVPDKLHVHSTLVQSRQELSRALVSKLQTTQASLEYKREQLSLRVRSALRSKQTLLESKRLLLTALNPATVLARGFSVVRTDGTVVRTANELKPGQTLDIQFVDGYAETRVVKVRYNKTNDSKKTT